MRILIADDEEEFTAFLKERLDIEGYAVDVAGDGEAALDLLKKQKYDILFIDHNMPEKSGIEVTKYIRENKIDVIVVMVTGYEEMEEFFAKRLGIDEYLTKPVKIADVEAILKKYKGKAA